MDLKSKFALTLSRKSHDTIQNVDESIDIRISNISNFKTEKSGGIGWCINKMSRNYLSLQWPASCADFLLTSKSRVETRRSARRRRVAVCDVIASHRVIIHRSVFTTMVNVKWNKEK